MLHPERLFGLSAPDGRRAVRPGEIVRLRFRARNAAEVASPPAFVRFTLPEGWTALDEVEVAISPLRPGAEHAVWLPVRADVADERTARSPFQAVLVVEGTALGTNIVHIAVEGRPLLDGAASSVRCEALTDGTLRAHATIVNEGDAAAKNVRLVVPAPPGYAADERAMVRTCEVLHPGERIAFTVDMTPVAAGGAVVRVDDAYVAYDGGRAAIPTAAEAQRTPSLLAPVITLRRTANRLDGAVVVENDGWIAARDVPAHIALPPGWRMLRGTLLIEEAPVTVQRGGDEAEAGMTLALIPARGSITIRFVATAARARSGGDVTVRAGERSATAAIPPAALRAVRIEVRPETAFAEPGSTVAVAIDVYNAGDVTERVTVAANGERAPEAELRPGAIATLDLRLPVSADTTDGEPYAILARAVGDDGLELAAAQSELRVIDRPWLVVESVVRDAGTARVTIRNAGATTARGVAVDGDVRLEALAPRAQATLAIDLGTTPAPVLAGARGAAIALDVAEPVPEPQIDARWQLPATIRNGERLAVRLHVVAVTALGTLRVRAANPPAVVYVAGSATINGHGLLDGVEGPAPLWGDGLALYDVPAGTVVDVGWAVVPRGHGELLFSAELWPDDRRIDAVNGVVAILAGAPFVVRPKGLPFHVDAATVDAPAEPVAEAPAPPQLEPPHIEAEAAPVERIAAPSVAPASAPAVAMIPAAALPTAALPTAALPVVPVPAEPPGGGQPLALLPLDETRSSAIRRVLRGARGPGVAAHLASFAVLFPAALAADDPQLGRAFAEAGDAIRSVYERLFVKLRIPGYDVTAFDLEDARARRALCVLLDEIEAAPAGALRSDTGSAELVARLDRGRLAALRSALATAPLGDVAALVAVARMLPTDGTTEVAQALGAYAHALAQELDAARALAGDAFSSYLTLHHSPTLDTARDAAVAALELQRLASWS